MSLVSYEARAIDTPCEIDIKEFIQRIIRLISGQIMARRTIISRQGFKCETTPVASWIPHSGCRRGEATKTETETVIQKRKEMKQLGIKIYILTAPDCGSSIWKASYMYFTSKNTDVFAMHTSYNEPGQCSSK